VLYHALNSWSCWASISTYTKKIPRPFCAMGPSPLSRSVSSCGHVACAPAIPSEPPARRAHAEQPSAHPVHDDTSPPAERWRAGSALRSAGAGDGSARSSPVRQDGRASSTRHAVSGDTRHCWMVVIRRDATMAAVQRRLSHAWMTHTSFGVCRTPPLRRPACVVCRARGARVPARHGVRAITGFDAVLRAAARVPPWLRPSPRLRARWSGHSAYR
jgi:hypothetical protein